MREELVFYMHNMLNNLKGAIKYYLIDINYKRSQLHFILS